MMRKVVIMVLVAIIISPLCHAADNVTHKFDDLKFSIGCPSDWEVRRLAGAYEGMVGILLPPDSTHKGFRANMIVTSRSNSQPPIDLEAFCKVNLDKMSQAPSLPDFSLIESRRLEIGNRDAYEVVFTNTHMNLNIPIKSLQIYIVTPRDIYIINYGIASEVYEKYIDKVDEVISSFRPLE